MDTEEVGVLPSEGPPSPGDRLVVRVSGRPPVKTIGRSMRNPQSSERSRFLALRHAAIDAMHGRKWYEGPVSLEVILEAVKPYPFLERDYVGGMLDTLGGSQGPSFIYLPIAFLDDSQVVEIAQLNEIGDMEAYELHIKFL